MNFNAAELEAALAAPNTGKSVLFDLDATVERAKELMSQDASTLDGEERGALLPKPSGYRILIALPRVAEKTTGGIIRTDTSRINEETASNLGFVLALGPDAYGDKRKFPTGAWCKEGDFVVLRSYSGTRFRVRGQELRLVNDDMIEAVVEDPRSFERF